MKRRNFLKITSTASALSLLPSEVFALFKSAGMAACPNVGSKKIVLIQLAGANDGLNTVIPINQYDAYAALRPNIKLSNTGTNGIINLDTTLSAANQVGLHPSMTGFKSLYDRGFMRLIQGVGYPVQDKSHFKSTDLWLTGGDGTASNNNIGDGWMGRFLESYYDNFLTANFPLGLELGSNDNSLGFNGVVANDLSISIGGQDPAGFYSVISGLGGAAPTTIPNSDYGTLLKYILDKDKSTNTYAQSISTAFNAGTNSSTVTYPNTSLSNQLKTVARFISGGLQTKVYLVKIGGFDTHINQIAANTTSHIGTHANLLAQVSDAVNNFITDLNAQNKADDVLAVTFSEFGRKAGENANLGTDHGEIAPMFVFGKSIKAGISGTNVNLAEAVSTNDFQLKTVQHDYRRVFGTILQDWFGTSNKTLDLTFYDYTNNIGFANKKIPDLIKSPITTNCYIDTVGGGTLGVDQETIVSNEISVYPNPTSDLITISATNSNSVKEVTIYGIDGKNVGQYQNESTTDLFSINVESLTAGLYTLKVNTEKGNFTKKIIIRR
jgi:uncharacterized protein (DUF1501 family)